MSNERTWSRGLPSEPECAISSAITHKEEPMGQVIVRNLDDTVIAALKARAKLHRHSLEQELRALLAAAARPSPEDRLALADRVRAMTPKRRQTSSTVLIREDRDR